MGSEDPCVREASRALIGRLGRPPSWERHETEPFDQMVSPQSARGSLNAGTETPIRITDLLPGRTYCGWGYVWNRGPGEMLVKVTGPDGAVWEHPLDSKMFFPTAGWFWRTLTLQNVDASNELRYVVVAR